VEKQPFNREFDPNIVVEITLFPMESGGRRSAMRPGDFVVLSA
jgi:hypothetical protein